MPVEETGNLYTASIFLAMSSLECDLADGTPLAGKRIGFVAYGSGSKAKIFEAIVRPGWADVAAHFHVFDKLRDRQAVNYIQHEARIPAFKPLPFILYRVGGDYKALAKKALL